jgi:hypothetical protein
MARQSRRSVSTHVISDEFIQWAESLSGFVAQIDLEYGGVAEMVEHPQWDSARNQYAVALLEGLRKDVGKLAKELKVHVNDYQKVL